MEIMGKEIGNGAAAKIRLRSKEILTTWAT
jgi:hypothetical protein